MTFKRTFIFLIMLLFPLIVHASFIESTIGTAVVNDATASFYNPAALTLLKNPQVISLDSFATLHTHFKGEATPKISGISEAGSSSVTTHYFFPSVYFGIPLTERLTFGFAILTNFFNNDVEENAVLRYAQSNSRTESMDLVSAMGVRINEYISIGAGVNISYADFLLRPLTGIPNSNIPDAHSRNEADDIGLGGDIGILLQPTKSLLLGFNYHSAITYKMQGKSELNGNQNLSSSQYAFHFWTPASSALSMNYFITPSFGVISTIRYVEWNIFKNLHVRGAATQIGNRAVIMNGSVPYHFHNTWLLTLGAHYRFTPKWIVRMAGTYNQSPSSGQYQVSTGDSFILGASTGYEVNKYFQIDGSYAHGFIQNKIINSQSGRTAIHGINKALRDSASLKLIFNIY